MCAIIDSNVVAQAFGGNRNAAGEAFRKAVTQGQTRLVVGGELLDELDRNLEFRSWRDTAVRIGRVEVAKREEVDRVAQQLRQPRGKVYSTGVTRAQRRLLVDPALCRSSV